MATQDYVVICFEPNNDGSEYVLATRRLFTHEQATRYAATLARGRYPRVIPAAEYLVGYCNWRYAID